jgi:hypothetical protein
MSREKENGQRRKVKASDEDATKVKRTSHVTIVARWAI